ncbi:MAG: glycosyltransferase, partial [Candidatus Falkowbacteria bacterium]|nr:glycosyltransferase [Candidatus Falkowbacteria bacterium]
MEINIWQFILDCTHLVSNWLIDLNYIFINIKTPFTIFFSQFFSIIGLVTFLSLWGFNFSFWGIMGFFRLIEEKFKQIKLSAISKVKNLSIDVPANKITKTEVAIIVPAHNEELVVAKTINSLLRLVSPSNIFIISDGSVDKTAAIVRNYNVQVLELSPAHGKAGALEAGIRYFSLDQRFQAV